MYPCDNNGGDDWTYNTYSNEIDSKPALNVEVIKATNSSSNALCPADGCSPFSKMGVKTCYKKGCGSPEAMQCQCPMSCCYSELVVAPDEPEGSLKIQGKLQNSAVKADELAQVEKLESDESGDKKDVQCPADGCSPFSKMGVTTCYKKGCVSPEAAQCQCPVSCCSSELR